VSIVRRGGSDEFHGEAFECGQITRTRLSTGEGGSSRQIQLAAKIVF
jgi:hypothetical protein